MKRNSCVYRVASARNLTFGASSTHDGERRGDHRGRSRVRGCESGGGSPAEKQKREKRPSQNRPRGGTAGEKGPQKYETGEGPREREIVVGTGGGRKGLGGGEGRKREVAVVGH